MNHAGPHSLETFTKAITTDVYGDLVRVLMPNVFLLQLHMLRLLSFQETE